MESIGARQDLARDITFLKECALRAVVTLGHDLRFEPRIDPGVLDAISAEHRRRADQLEVLGGASGRTRSRGMVAQSLLEGLGGPMIGSEKWTSVAVLLAADPIVDDVLRGAKLDPASSLRPELDSTRSIIVSHLAYFVPPNLTLAELADSYHRTLVVTGQWIEERAEQFVALGTTWLEVISQTWLRPSVEHGTSGILREAVMLAKQRSCPFVALSACPLAYARRQSRATGAPANISDLCRRSLAVGAQASA